ncbi:MAG: DUF2149 domain-containing protein, partial [Methanobacterium sp.]
NREDEDPMAGSANLVDAMLVIAVGLLIFLVISGDMQSAVFSEESPQKKKVSNESMQNASEVQMGEDIADTSQEGFVEMGRVYKDPKTGKLIMAEG